MTLGELQIVIGGDISPLQAQLTAGSGMLRSFAAEAQVVAKATGLSTTEVNRLTLGTKNLGAAAGDALPKMTRGSNQANVAVMALSRGLSDAAFGWQFALNNLDPFIGSLGAMRAQAAASGTTVTKMLVGSLAGPAGLMAILGLATFAAAKFGPAISKAFDDGSKAAERLKKAAQEALDAIVQVEGGPLGVRVTPQNALGILAEGRADVELLNERLEREKEVSAQIQERIKLLKLSFGESAAGKILSQEQLDLLNLQLSAQQAQVKETERQITLREEGLAFVAEEAEKLREQGELSKILAGWGATRVEAEREITEELERQNQARARQLPPSGLPFGDIALPPSEVILRNPDLDLGDPLKILTPLELLAERYRTLRTEAELTSAVAIVGMDAIAHGVGDLAAELVSLNATWESVGDIATGVLRQIAGELAAAAAKALIFRAIFAAFNPASAVPTFGSVFFSMLGFGGGRASGGFVSPGTAYMVGERGPEMFVPGTSGSVVPNHALGMGSSVNVRGELTMRRGHLSAQLYSELVEDMRTGTPGPLAQAILGR